MKNNFEKELEQVINEKKEISIKVRKSIDQSYDQIRTKSKKKKENVVWKRVATAACALVITGVILTNEQVMAGINELFNFGDEGVEQAVNNGFILENNSVATDQDIKITLDNYLSDANKLGMSFQLVFEDATVLKDMEDVSMDYRLKNGDGEYIQEFIPDTKPLKGENIYISGHEYHVSILDEKAGIVQFDVLMESNKGNIPTLKDAVVEVESINIFKGVDEIKKVAGNWELTVTNHDNEKSTSVQYVMHDKSSTIQVSEATGNPTSLHVIFSLDGIYDDENMFAHRMKIIDEDGNDYQTKGFEMSTQNGETTISTNFPITSYTNFETLTLTIEGIGKVKLLKK